MQKDQERLEFLKDLRAFIADQAQSVKSITLTAQFKNGKEVAKEMPPEAFIALIDKELGAENAQK